MQKVLINQKFYGSLELENTDEARRVFSKVKSAFGSGKTMEIGLLFPHYKLKALERYQKGGARQELADIELYIELGKILRFDTQDGQKLKNSIELINDIAHNHYNISKRLTLINKPHSTQNSRHYLFWDIENFSNIGSMFNDVIEKYDIPDDHIYVAANPDSLYLFRKEWEAELYDYKKTLTSFNFTKCDHGKNVADDVLLANFQGLTLHNTNIYLMTFDRELKERFNAQCHISNNLYILEK
ncbi:MAG: hypothetical protein PHQ22_05220 [Sulfuricurvum sp.]|nr:hypothetical protein [Sulfuricurvum sp.]MDD5386581.1 hypothetical protein [Sulfuricurvum sp.]